MTITTSGRVTALFVDVFGSAIHCLISTVYLHVPLRVIVQCQEAPKNGQPLPVVEQNETCFK